MSTQISELTDGILSLIEQSGFSAVEATAMNRLLTFLQNICMSAHKPINPVMLGMITRSVSVFNETKATRTKTVEDLFWSFNVLLFRFPLGRLTVKRLFNDINSRKEKNRSFDSLGGTLLREPFDVVQVKLNPDDPKEAFDAAETEAEDQEYYPYGFRNCNLRPNFLVIEGEYTVTPEPSISTDDHEVTHKSYCLEDLPSNSDWDDCLPILQTETSQYYKQCPPWNQLPPDLIEEPAVCFLCDSLMAQFSKVPPLPTFSSQFDKIEPFLIPPPTASHRAFGGYGAALNQIIKRNCQLGT